MMFKIIILIYPLMLQRSCLFILCLITMEKKKIKQLYAMPKNKQKMHVK